MQTSRHAPWPARPPGGARSRWACAESAGGCAVSAGRVLFQQGAGPFGNGRRLRDEPPVGLVVAGFLVANSQRMERLMPMRSVSAIH